MVWCAREDQLRGISQRFGGPPSQLPHTSNKIIILRTGWQQERVGGCNGGARKTRPLIVRELRKAGGAVGGNGSTSAADKKLRYGFRGNVTPSVKRCIAYLFIVPNKVPPRGVVLAACTLARYGVMRPDQL